MVAIPGQGVAHQYRLRGVVEARLDVVEADDAVDLAHIEIAMTQRQAVGHVETAGQGAAAVCLAVAVVVAQGIHGAPRARPDEQGALLAEDHRPRIGDVVSEDLDLKAGRQLNLLDRQIAGAGIAPEPAARDKQPRDASHAEPPRIADPDRYACPISSTASPGAQPLGGATTGAR